MPAPVRSRGPLALGRLKVGAGALSVMAVTGVLVPVAYHVMFTGWLFADDEGYLLISLKSFAGEGHLYTDVYSQYGPFFFEVWGGVFSLFDISVSHDAGRMATLVLWLGTSALMGVTAWRLSGSMLIGLAIQLLSFRLLNSLHFEPMHPGGLISLLLACMAAVAFFLFQRRPRLAAVLLGGLLSALVLTKVNVGLLACASFALAAVVTYPALAGRRVLRALVELAFVATPVVLINSDFGLGWAREFSAHVTLAALSVVIALRALPTDPDREPDELLWVLSGFGGTALVVSMIALITGTVPIDLVKGVLIKPLEQPSAFNLPYNLPPWSIPFDLLLLALAIGYRTAQGRRLLQRRSGIVAHAVISIAAAVFLVMTVSTIRFPAYATTTHIYELSGIAVVWIALVPVPGGGPALFPLRLLAAVAVLQPLHAYPVAGTQVHFAALLLLLVAAACMCNGLRGLIAVAVEPRPRGALTAVAVLATALLTLSIANLVIRTDGATARQAYDDSVELRLPGASRIRLPPDQARLLRRVTATLRTRCQSVLMMPGLGSFYFWTRQDPPTGLNATAWMTLFDDETQRRVVESVRGRRRLCVLKDNAAAEAWLQGAKLRSAPLVEFIREEFRPRHRDTGYTLMTREKSPGHR